jgi:hypothetical protein
VGDDKFTRGAAVFFIPAMIGLPGVRLGAGQISRCASSLPILPLPKSPRLFFQLSQYPSFPISRTDTLKVDITIRVFASHIKSN